MESYSEDMLLFRRKHSYLLETNAAQCHAVHLTPGQKTQEGENQVLI